jgi:hypothetical protein
LDLTIEPWLQGFWPALKETLKKLRNSTESSVDNLSESVNQLNLSSELKPTVERQLSSKNKFKSTEDSITYSALLAELTTLTLPPKPAHSLSIQLIESSEVTINSRGKKKLPNFHLFYFQVTDQSPSVSDSSYHSATLTRRECLTHDDAIKPVMSVELQFSVS